MKIIVLCYIYPGITISAKWCLLPTAYELHAVYAIMHHMFIGLSNIPGRKSVTGPLYLVPYPPYFLQYSLVLKILTTSFLAISGMSNEELRLHLTRDILANHVFAFL